METGNVGIGGTYPMRTNQLRTATKHLLLGAALLLPFSGCAMLQPEGPSIQRHTAFRPPNYEASVDVRAPLDGSEKPEIVARITFGPNK